MATYREKMDALNRARTILRTLGSNKIGEARSELVKICSALEQVEEDVEALQVRKAANGITHSTSRYSINQKR